MKHTVRNAKVECGYIALDGSGPVYLACTFVNVNVAAAGKFEEPCFVNCLFENSDLRVSDGRVFRDCIFTNPERPTQDMPPSIDERREK